MALTTHDADGDTVTEATSDVEMNVLPGPPVRTSPDQHSSVMLVTLGKISKLQSGFEYVGEEKNIYGAMQRRRELTLCTTLRPTACSSVTP